MEFSSKDMHIYLHNEILDFVQWIQPSIDKKEQRENLVKHIKKVVKKEYPEAVVMVFGSCATGLNLPSSDIDLLVYNPSVSDQQMMNKLANSLLAEGICKSIEALKYAKVPLIKL
jgi:non-canonical poly(A) RNA polymerase PAPD5/7